jgi:hypothetical protein
LLSYFLGNLSTKGNPLKCSKSKRIVNLGSLGHELEALQKPPNRRPSQGIASAESPSKEAQGPHTANLATKE